MQTYTGGCHCGAIAYEADIDLKSAIECNCSHCSMQGALLTFIPESQFKLLKGADDAVEYRFNKHVIQHMFCKHCGIESYATGDDGKGNRMAAINVRCLTDLDLATVERMPYDGKSK